MLREFDPAWAGAPDLDVPDPYYGGADGFDHVLDLVEASCAGLLDHLRAARASIDRAQTLLRRVDAPDHAVSAIRAEADEIWRRLHAPDAHPGVLSDYCRDKAASLNVA